MLKLWVSLLIFTFHNAHIFSYAAQIVKSLGSEYTTIEEYPFMAYLHDVNEDTRGYLCSGTIIDKNWILTSSDESCIGSMNTTYVGVGSDTLIDVEYRRIHIKKAHYYQNGTGVRDLVALIELEQPLIFSETVQPVKLGKLEVDRVVQVLGLGWGGGSPNEEPKFGEPLRVLEQNTITMTTCKRLHSKDNNGAPLIPIYEDTEFCATVPQGRKAGMCYRDNGGPLIDKETKQQYGVLVRYRSCTGEFPSIYTRVEKHLNWINVVTKLNFSL